MCQSRRLRCASSAAGECAAGMPAAPAAQLLPRVRTSGPCWQPTPHPRPPLFLLLQSPPPLPPRPPPSPLRTTPIAGHREDPFIIPEIPYLTPKMTFESAKQGTALLRNGDFSVSAAAFC